VTLSGLELLAGSSGLSSVTLGGYEADIVSANASTVIVIAAAGSKSDVGDVVITALSGASVIRVDGWDYVAVANVTSISPSSGQFGTRVTINGTGLLVGGSIPQTITLALVDVREVVSASETSIVVIAANGTAGDGNVSYTMDSGAQVNAGNDIVWTYLTASEIANVEPNSGRDGTRVMIIGSSLLGGGNTISWVSLGGVQASIISGNDTHVQVVAASSTTVGAGHVTIVADTGATTLAEGAWTYLNSTISQIYPSSGQFNTLVTITGSGLLGGASVLESALIASRPATIVSYNDSMVILRAGDSGLNETGDQDIGEVELIGSTGARIVSDENAFVYLVEGNITSINPAVGPGFMTVTIQGTSLFGGASTVESVSLGGNDASIQTASETEIVVVS
jgi:hypothetical protein